jgi:hypothetical protein
MQQVTTSARSPGRWLDDPDRIAAHLVFAATDVKQVTVANEGRTVHGKLEMPTYERLVPFVPDPAYGGRVEPPLRGMPAKLSYGAHDASYAFDTTIAGVDEEGRWLVQAPTRVETSDRRLVHRFDTLGDPAFELELDGPWQPSGFRPFSLLDISTDGLGVVFNPYQTPMQPNDLIGARLLLPTAFTFMPMLLRVANVRPFRSGSNLRAAGTRFVDLPLEKRKSLALSISVWHEHRKVA